MSDSAAQPLALGDAYEEYASRPVKSRGWERALTIWNAILTEYQESASQFIDGLTQSQYEILRALIEWWHGDFDPARTVEDLKVLIEEHAKGPNTEKALYFSNSKVIQQKPRGYQETLALAFASEFYDYPDGRPQTIQFRRNKAGIVAACVRAGHFTRLQYTNQGVYLRREMAIDSQNRWPYLSRAILESCPWLRDGKDNGLPYYLWDIEAKKTILVQELNEVPTYTVVSHTWGRWKVPHEQPSAVASIAGVPWAIPRNAIFDIEELPEIFSACFKESRFPKYLWLDLFCIPQDYSRIAEIEIARQAAIFRSANRALCWLNMMDDWSGLRAALHWLALRGLAYEFGPGNDIEAVLTSMEDALLSPTQLFYGFSQHVPENPDLAIGHGPCPWFTSLWTLQELCLRPDMLLFDRNWTPFRLFDEPSSPEVPLDTILALCEFWKKNIYDSLPEVPPAVTELVSLMETTSLLEILDLDPLDILTVASNRYCMERRAEAIMSAIGVTNWYQETPKELREQNLVLGTYPIQFLREIRDREGARFFASLYGEICCYWDIFEQAGKGGQPHQLGLTCVIETSDASEDGSSSMGLDENNELEDNEADGEEIEVDVQVAGTMLPFDTRQSSSKFMGTGVSGNGHPTTTTWILNDDGIVFMPKVAILASTDDRMNEDTNKGIVATIMSASEEKPSKMAIMESQNLHEYLLNALVGHGERIPKHAISILCREDGWTQGAILMQVIEQDGDTPAKTFAKLGDFFIFPQGRLIEPREWEVNWEIL